MNVSDAVRRRISTRAFLPTPVDEAVVRDILETACRAPSGGNLQPWRVHVVTGAARVRVIAAAVDALANPTPEDAAELKVYPDSLWEPFRTRRYVLGEEMYALLGVAKSDLPAKFEHLKRNYQFFGAPVGLFFSLDRRFDKGQWAHLGMLMQTIALVAEEKGLATCMQEAWSVTARPVARALGLPDTDQLYCGMALGHADPDAAVNRLRSARAPLEEFATFLRD